MSPSRRLAAGFALSVAIAGPAYRLRTLSGDGALAAIAVGTSIFGRGGIRPALALIAFFVTSSALSKLPGGLPKDAAASRRNARQVAANGGLPALAAALGGGRSGSSGAALRGALAAAAADTWATEIGVRWGGTPRSIWGNRPVERGDSGGVTPVGTAGGLAGAAVIAAVTGFPDARAMVAGTAAGLAGMLLDSLLGATAQARFLCVACGRPTEQRRHCGLPAQLVSGPVWLDNDAVNLIGSVGGAIAGRALDGRVAPCLVS